MDWLQRLEIVSRSETTTEEERNSLLAFLAAYRKGGSAHVAGLTGLVASQYDARVRWLRALSLMWVTGLISEVPGKWGRERP